MQSRQRSDPVAPTRFRLRWAGTGRHEGLSGRFVQNLAQDPSLVGAVFVNPDHVSAILAADPL